MSRKGGYLQSCRQIRQLTAFTGARWNVIELALIAFDSIEASHATAVIVVWAGTSRIDDFELPAGGRRGGRASGTRAVGGGWRRTSASRLVG
jgi:hypothetical protein